MVVCRPGHSLLTEDRPDITAVFRYPLVGPRAPTEDVEAILQLAPVAARAELRRRGYLAVTCDSLPVLKTVLQTSDALCLMNLFMVADELRTGALAVLPAHFDFERRATFGVAWQRCATWEKLERVMGIEPT